MEQAYNKAVSPIYVRYLYGRCPVYVRYESGHVPDKYRTYSGQRQEMHRRYAGATIWIEWRYADDMKGWALVKVMDDRCSRQTIVTRCTLCQRYMTEDALEVAADSYGGLTDTPYLSPR